MTGCARRRPIVLAVCTGNICRSPALATILERRLGGSGEAPSIAVASAGIHAVVGAPMHELTRAALRSRGFEVAAHSARQVEPRHVREAALILVMEEHQRRFLYDLAPDRLRRIFLLAELRGRASDVDDPVAGGPAEHQRMVDELLHLTDPSSSRLSDLVAGIASDARSTQ